MSNGNGTKLAKHFPMILVIIVCVSSSAVAMYQVKNNGERLNRLEEDVPEIKQIVTQNATNLGWIIDWIKARGDLK